MSKPSSKDLQWTRSCYTLMEILKKCSLPIILQNSDYKQAVLWVDQIFTSGALCARGKRDHFLLVPHNSPLLQKLQIYKDATKPQLEALPISSKNKFHIATGYKKTQFDWENFKSLVKSKIEELKVFHPKTISKVVFQFDSNPLNSYTAVFPRCISFHIKEIEEEQESGVEKPTQSLVAANQAKETQQSLNAKYEGSAVAAPIKEDIGKKKEDTSVHKEVEKRKHKNDRRKQVPREREQKIHEHEKKRKQRISHLHDKQVATGPVLSFSEQINQKAFQIGQLNDLEISQNSHPSTSGSNVSQIKAEVPHKGVSVMAAKVESKFKDEKIQMSEPSDSSRLEERKVLHSPVHIATPTIEKTSEPTPIIMPTNVGSYPSGNTPKLVDKNPTTPTPAVKIRPVTTPMAVTSTQAAKPAPKVAKKTPAVRKKLVPKPSESIKRYSEPSISKSVERPTRPLSEIILTLNASSGGIMGINPSQSKPKQMSLGYDQSNNPPWEAFNVGSRAADIPSKQRKNECKPPDVKKKPQKPQNLNLKLPPNESKGKCDIPQLPGIDAGKSVTIVSPTIANIIERLSVDGEPKIPMAAGSGFSNPSGGTVKILGKNQNPKEHIYDEIREPIFDAKKSTVTDPKIAYDTILHNEAETKNYVALVKRNGNQDNDVPSKLVIPKDPYSGAYVNVQSYE
ncbi:neurofilament medium polypeptide-like isoform X2 [Anneissia japonica]|uniref:neurofilament medium polypeptide-like isoform X2 n=1 Tax=Anneissia japonica TaxID=1529436 RepID=UPI00142581A5|nr:neurofilament medium polypeptide-like isoform X2 [Anneissia japonica]